MAKGQMRGNKEKKKPKQDKNKDKGGAAPSPFAGMHSQAKPGTWGKKLDPGPAVIASEEKQSSLDAGAGLLRYFLAMTRWRLSANDLGDHAVVRVHDQ